jgi:hypothetical protein
MLLFSFDPILPFSISDKGDIMQKSNVHITKALGHKFMSEEKILDKSLIKRKELLTDEKLDAILARAMQVKIKEKDGEKAPFSNLSEQQIAQSRAIFATSSKKIIENYLHIPVIKNGKGLTKKLALAALESLAKVSGFKQKEGFMDSMAGLPTVMLRAAIESTTRHHVDYVKSIEDRIAKQRQMEKDEAARKKKEAQDSN